MLDFIKQYQPDLAAIQILALWIAIYWLLRFMQGTRGEGVLKGFGLAFVIAFPLLFLIAALLNLDAIIWVLKAVMATGLVALIIIFQPEIRQGLIQLGHNPITRMFFKTKSKVIEEVVKCAGQLAARNIGALIAFERETDLVTYVKSGVTLDSEVTVELLSTIFSQNTVLHDGAVIIKNNRIAAAGCLFPISENTEISRSFGTRHRAGLGISEESDAVSVIVSEETGAISLCVGGKLHNKLESAELRQMLEKLCLVEREDSGSGNMAIQHGR